MWLGLNLEPIVEVFEQHLDAVEVCIVVIAAMLAFALAMALVERLNAPVARILRQRRFGV
jgi:hypothetical protein